MNRTKSILVAAGVMLALAFTLSCSTSDSASDDESSSWLISNIKTYTVTDGIVGGVASETTYIKYN